MMNGKQKICFILMMITILFSFVFPNSEFADADNKVVSFDLMGNIDEWTVFQEHPTVPPSTISFSTEKVKEGKYSMKIMHVDGDSLNNYMQITRWIQIDTAQYGIIKFWVYGDNSGHVLKGWFMNEKKGYGQTLCWHRINWQGWKEFKISIAQKRISGIRFTIEDKGSDDIPSTATIYISGLKLINEISFLSSGYYDHNYPSNIFDKNLSTKWQPPASTGWISIRFANPIKATQIKLYLNTDLVYSLHIDYKKPDLDLWIPLVERIENFNGKVLTENFSRVEIKEVRISVDDCRWKHDRQRKEWVWINECSFEDKKPLSSDKDVAIHISDFLRSNSNLPYTFVSKLPSDFSINIDGDLKEDAWKYATTQILLSSYGNLPKNPTEVMITYDSNNFYVGFICYENNMSKLVAKHQKDGEALWTDDCVEIFISPINKRYYYHIIFNPNAKTYTGSFTQEVKKWHPNIKVASSINSQFWIIEAAIPFSTDIPAPEPGTLWRVNFTREEKPGNELSCWSPTYGGFHKPNYFGILKFTENQSPISIKALFIRNDNRLKIKTIFEKSKYIFNILTDTSEIVTAELLEEKGKIKTFLSEPINEANGAQLIFTNKKGEIVSRSAVLKLSNSTIGFRLSKIKNYINETKNYLENRISDNTDKSLYRSKIKELERKIEQLIDESNEQHINTEIAKIENNLARIRCSLYAKKYNNKPLYGVGTANSLIKIDRNTPWLGNIGGPVNLDLARNEAESFQLVLWSFLKESLNFKIDVTLHHTLSGQVWPDKDIQIREVGYVKVLTRAASFSLKMDEYPDPLLSKEKYEVLPNKLTCLWITVKSQWNTPPGKYRGTITVTPSIGPETKILLNVRVRDWAIPLKKSIATPFGINPGMIEKYYNTKQGTEKYNKILNNLINSMMENKLDWFLFPAGHMQETIYPKVVWTGSELEVDYTEFDEKLEKLFSKGLSVFSVGLSFGHFPKIYRQDGTIEIKYSHKQFNETSKVLFQNYVRNLTQHLRKKGWLDKAFLYIADEPRSEHIKQIIYWASAVKEVAPDLPIMITTMGMEPLEDYIDIWCPNLAFFNSSECTRSLKKGKKVWWYVCMGGYKPNFIIDYRPIEHRVIFWLSYRFGITGVLYWRVNEWRGNPYVETGKYAGDGYLYYPGEKDNVVESIRLHVIRDGIEDFEVLSMLPQKCDNLRMQKQLDTIRTKLMQITKSLQSYSENPDDYINLREQIYEFLEKLKKSRK